MAKRPEGLSPCFYSLASPDIPESHKFKWTPHTTQTSATITIYEDDATTVLKTYAVSGSTTEVDMSDVGYAFDLGTNYYWSVTVAGSMSMKARFQYDSCAISPSITWSYIPKPGDVVVADTYFQEMKDNIITVMEDYEGAPDSLINKIQDLFTGEIVPSRDDFVTLESVVNYLSTQLEDYKAVNIDEPVENSLSVDDLEVVRNHIDNILNVQPKPVQALSISVGSPTMYQIRDLNSSHDTNKDPTIDLTWTVESIPSYNGTFTFDKVSPSKDIRYYQCLFSYGPSSAPFISELYFREDGMFDGKYRSFDTNWDGLYDANTIGLAKQSLDVIAVDHRGNKSSVKSVTKVYGSNFKAPLGVKQYEVQYQKAARGDKNGPYPDKTWYPVYTGQAMKATHKVTGGDGTLYYRVRAVDYSGLVTDWEYVEGITFDPLTPPSAPYNLKCVEVYKDKLVWSWSHGQRVEYYEVVVEYSSNGYNVANWNIGDNETIINNASRSGLNSSTKYTFWIRSVNRVGKSDWVSVKATTKSDRKTSAKKATKGDSWNTGYKSLRSGRWVGSSWRHEDGLVYQGEWTEIKGSPNYIGPPGQKWGNHKGMWIFDDNWWRDTLAGKDIIKVEIWIQRKGKAHGYYNDQVPTFWLHNYDNFPSGEPKFTNKFQPGKEFDLGESGWVTLPNYYGEYIRDNKAKGIGIYRDNWGELPYIKFYDNAQLRITYE
jgi:hypothetical protein